MIRWWPSKNTFGMWTVLYWTLASRTQFGVSINVWWLAGDTLNITCNFEYCNHQVSRDLLITLYMHLQGDQQVYIYIYIYIYTHTHTHTRFYGRCLYRKIEYDRSRKSIQQSYQNDMHANCTYDFIHSNWLLTTTVTWLPVLSTSYQAFYSLQVMFQENDWGGGVSRNAL